MKNLLKSITQGKKVLILGFGREGRSTLRLLKEVCPETDLTVADADPDITDKNPVLKHQGISVRYGADYLGNLDQYDLIIKSPGISFKHLKNRIDIRKITSQTDIFLNAYSNQIAGITGTKGKSTTSSLLYHINKLYTTDTLLAGNIGIPLFDLVPEITTKTRIVCELSSHQLQFLSKGPHVTILLNLYQEHLDHYESFFEYQLAKFQAGLKQSGNDFFIWTAADNNTKLMMMQHPLKSNSLPVYHDSFKGNGIGVSGADVILRISGKEKILIPKTNDTRLIGEHNLINIRAAAAAASLMNIPSSIISQGISTFIPLEHRIEFVGTYKNKRYYNDSISTIPEATIVALKTLKKVNTLILGGFDRGIDYSILKEFLKNITDISLVFTGPAGERMMRDIVGIIKDSCTAVFEKDFRKAIETAISLTPEEGTCLLSPAASSYDSFKNFEERGKCFKDIVRS